jgi:hypothetical protein
MFADMKVGVIPQQQKASFCGFFVIVDVGVMTQ